MGCCVQFGWGGQQDPSAMTFEERLEEGEGGAVYLGGKTIPLGGTAKQRS